eukprot:TRINITY_DN741_c1_g1_i6.p1 TRINITY_DN741_c1_g1~~TRINITY_DN741_c1_g1_i6.p1  ORF type:complete len:578 (-),score=85.27 TRINITY_DN741_c1_g1_i6:440-2173(-)
MSGFSNSAEMEFPNSHPNASVSVSDLLLQAALMIPVYSYVLGILVLFLVFLYNFFEMHFVEHLVRGLRGDAVSLIYDPRSEIFHSVVSKCRILRGRYLPTLWLASPHFQTAFLSLLDWAPPVEYKRQVFHLPDGGNLALDWLVASDDVKVSGGGASLSKDDATPIVVVIPGLTSDSAAVYVKHLAYRIAKRGWNVVVSNHRGLGGVSITSDIFYNAGWTEDLRRVVNYLHQERPMAPLFAVGTSIGANILVKYLGEDGDNTPVAGAASICSPWDLLICDRFIHRRLVQRLYNRVLTNGLQGYAELHEPIYSRLANWEGIKKSRSIRDFDQHATCLVGKFETPDTYYRYSSSASFVRNVTVPLLCISALDDPLCTKEAIPYDECRSNKNVVLATVRHGGHLAFFEGITAGRLWWVCAVEEFLTVLQSSPFMHTQKKTGSSGLHSSIDKGPYVNVTEDGMVMALADNQTDEQDVVDLSIDQITPNDETENPIQYTDQSKHKIEANEESFHETAVSPEQKSVSNWDIKDLHDITAPVKRCMHHLSRQNRRSIWLLAYIAIVTTWPLVGSSLFHFFKRKPS